MAQAMSKEDRIIKIITTFSSTPSPYPKRPYRVLKRFLCKKNYDAKNTTELIAKKLEKAYENRKNDFAIGEWHDYVPYCMCRCFIYLLQDALNPVVLRDWNAVASAIAYYCTNKTCEMTTTEIKKYYDIRRAPDGLSGSYFAFCKKEAREAFAKNGKLIEEKKELLGKFRAFAGLYGDSRMNTLLSNKILLTQN